MSETSARLMLGDCLERMAEIESGSVNAIVTDPPYGQSNESYDKGTSVEVWRECYRVARPNACLVSFAGSPTYHRIASQIEAAGWQVRQMWGWIYRDGMITSAWPKEGFDRLAPAMDPICFATKGKVLLDLEREGGEDWYWSKAGRSRGKNSYSDRASNHGKNAAQGRWPRSLISADDIPGLEYFVLSRTMGGHNPEKTGHPNQKPLALMEWIIRKLIARTILDPYCGSGTTGLACLNTGRDFIGIERDPGYFATAESRLALAAPSPSGAI